CFFLLPLFEFIGQPINHFLPNCAGPLLPLPSPHRDRRDNSSPFGSGQEQAHIPRGRRKEFRRRQCLHRKCHPGTLPTLAGYFHALRLAPVPASGEPWQSSAASTAKAGKPYRLGSRPKATHAGEHVDNVDHGQGSDRHSVQPEEAVHHNCAASVLSALPQNQRMPEICLGPLMPRSGARSTASSCGTESTSDSSRPGPSKGSGSRVSKQKYTQYRS